MYQSTTWCGDTTQRLIGSVLSSALALLIVLSEFSSGSAKAETDKRYMHSGTEYFSAKIYGKPSPRMVKTGNAIPRGNGYRVAGRVGKSKVRREYVPGEIQVGKASWYGDAFHGRKTANGEIYDKAAMSAAHPSFPLPCYVRVTNLGNGRSVIVRVNDRGPYVANRAMDLSRRSAEALGYVRAGIADVKITYLGKASLDSDVDHVLAATLRTDGTPAAFAAPLLSKIASRTQIITRRMAQYVKLGMLRLTTELTIVVAEKSNTELSASAG